MSIYDPTPSPWAPRMLAIFRIVAGGMFITFGSMKLFGYPENPMPNMPPIELWSQMGIGGMLELAGGILIVLGLLTRPGGRRPRRVEPGRRDRPLARQGPRGLAADRRRLIHRPRQMFCCVDDAAHIYMSGANKHRRSRGPDRHRQECFAR
jgi:hypothetical protein